MISVESVDSHEHASEVERPSRKKISTVWRPDPYHPRSPRCVESPVIGDDRQRPSLAERREHLAAQMRKQGDLGDLAMWLERNLDEMDTSLGQFRTYLRQFCLSRA